MANSVLCLSSLPYCSAMFCIDCTNYIFCNKLIEGEWGILSDLDTFGWMWYDSYLDNMHKTICWGNSLIMDLWDIEVKLMLYRQKLIEYRKKIYIYIYYIYIYNIYISYIKYIYYIYNIYIIYIIYIYIYKKLNFKIRWYWNRKMKVSIVQNAYIDKILISNKSPWGEKGLKYFIGYR